MTSQDTNKEQQEAGPTLEEQIEKMVRARLNGIDVLGGKIPGREKHVRECDAILASLRKLKECERDAGNAIDYIANSLNNVISHKVPPRWWCLRDDLKAVLRADAIKLVFQWETDESEIAAKYSRPALHSDTGGGV